MVVALEPREPTRIAYLRGLTFRVPLFLKGFYFCPTDQLLMIDNDLSRLICHPFFVAKTIAVIKVISVFFHGRIDILNNVRDDIANSFLKSIPVFFLPNKRRRFAEQLAG